jgi:hypothetical protein
MEIFPSKHIVSSKMKDSHMSRIILAIAFNLATLALLYAGDAPNKWPRSVNEAVSLLVQELDESSKDYLVGTPQENLSMLHLGWGMGIRNSFGLWRDNDDLLNSCGDRDMHPDDCSAIIMREVWKELRSKSDPVLIKRLDDQFELVKQIPIEYARFYDVPIEDLVQSGANDCPD